MKYMNPAKIHIDPILSIPDIREISFKIHLRRPLQPLLSTFRCVSPEACRRPGRAAGRWIFLRTKNGGFKPYLWEILGDIDGKHVFLNCFFELLIDSWIMRQKIVGNHEVQW